MRVLSLLLLALLSAASMAADAPTTKRKASDAAAPPALPENYNPPEVPDLSGQTEPEITITTKGTEIHHEYRMNGRLYMVKVVPAKGKPYYLIDHEGSGQFRRSEFEPRIAIPTWVIKRF